MSEPSAAQGEDLKEEEVEEEENTLTSIKSKYMLRVCMGTLRAVSVWIELPGYALCSPTPGDGFTHNNVSW